MNTIHRALSTQLQSIARLQTGLRVNQTGLRVNPGLTPAHNPPAPVLGPAAEVAPTLERAVDEEPVRAGIDPLRTAALASLAVAAATQNLSWLFGPTRPFAAVPPEDSAELAAPVPDTVELGGRVFTDISQTALDDGTTETRGTLDLAHLGLGQQEFVLDLDDSGVVTGAASVAQDAELSIGGQGLFLRNSGGGSLMTIDAQGAVTASGVASFEFLGQTREIAAATVTFDDSAADQKVSVNGEFQLDGRPVDVAFTFDEAGRVTADVGVETAEEFAPFLASSREFLDQLGVEVETRASVSFTVDTAADAYTVQAAGISFGYSGAENEVTVGGIGVGAGLAVTLETLKLDLDDGRFSGRLNAGVGVGAGGVGVGFDFAGFDFSFDPTTGQGTLAGDLGSGFAGARATADFQINDEGLAVSNLAFDASLDGDAVSRAAAAALDGAASEGRVRFDAMRDQVAAAAAIGIESEYFQAAAAAGDDMGTFIDAAAAVDEELGTFLDTSRDLAGQDLRHFLSVTSNAGDADAYVQGFDKTRRAIRAMGSRFIDVRVDTAGRFRAGFQVPGGNSSQLVFGLEAGRLTGRGQLRLGGYDFGQARFTFGQDGLSDVQAKTNIKYRGTGVELSAQMKGGKVEATGSFSVRVFGRRVGVGLSVGSSGLRVS
jgi:hypothetical protein